MRDEKKPEVTPVIHKEDTLEDKLKDFANGVFLTVPEDEEKDILTTHLKGKHGSN